MTTLWAEPSNLEALHTEMRLSLAITLPPVHYDDAPHTSGTACTEAGGCTGRVSGQSMSSDRCVREGGSSSKSRLRIRLRCHSLSTIICAKHMRRVLPMSRSTHGFCHAEYRVLSTSVIPRVSDSLPKGNAVAVVRSCRRYYGAASHGNSSTNG
jgi:hypothetical protein